MLWIIAAGVCAALVIASYYFSEVALHPKVYSTEQVYKTEAEQGKFSPQTFETLPHEEVQIRSPFGYELNGLYLPQAGAKKTVIIVHGITLCLYASIKYMWMFYKRGYNVFLYDHRNHGHSGGDNTSYGYYEKHDLKACVDWVLARNGADSIVGTHGESMGAATALQHAAIDPRLAFVVADCPYASAKNEFAYRLKVEYHVYGWILLPLASLITRLRAGWFFGDAAPIAGLAQIQTPIFFIHGANDKFIPPQASIQMHEQKPTSTTLWLPSNTGHAEAFWNNQEEYDQRVGAFLEQVVHEASESQ